jgi:hypothetical protein
LIERAEAGEFEMTVEGNTIDPPFIDYNDRRCVRTEELFIRDLRFPPGHHRHDVARAHQFKRESGEIGASGMPDPKDLMIGDTNYRGLKQNNPHCHLCESGDMIPLDQRFQSSKYKPGPE